MSLYPGTERRQVAARGCTNSSFCLQKWVPGLRDRPGGSGLGDLPVQDAGSWAHSLQPQKHCRGHCWLESGASNGLGQACALPPVSVCLITLISHLPHFLNFPYWFLKILSGCGLSRVTLMPC